MTHPIFRKEFFVETAFEKRFQAMLRSAWQRHSWHVIVADPGSGKTMGIRDMIRAAGSPAILAVTAPKNNEEEMALGNQFFTALGLPLRGRWSDRKPKLMGHLHQYGTQCLIVDDAHDLSLEHLMFIKELTDQGRLQYDHPLGLCLVAAGRGNTIPLKETLDLPDTTWLQFRRRLDKLEPFCRVAGHTSEEVREVLAALEKVYCEPLPQLNLRQWAGSIYTWLTQPVLDPTSSGRVTMDYLMKLVTTALEWTYQAGETDVRAETLEKAASLLVLRRDTLRIIDGAGPSLDALPSESNGLEQSSGTEAEQSLPRMSSLRNRLLPPRNRWIRLDLESRTRSSPPNRPNARFLGEFPLTSSVFWRVVLRSWNVPIVQARAPSNRMVGSCGSSLTTNAKRMLPIPDNDGSSAKRTGAWLEDSKRSEKQISQREDVIMADLRVDWDKLFDTVTSQLANAAVGKPEKIYDMTIGVDNQW